MKVTILILIILLIAAATAYYFFFYQNKKSKNPPVDYSYGLQEAQEALEYLNAEDYLELEKVLVKLSPDNLTLTLDYLALSSEEKSFQNWVKNASNKNAANTATGVFYHHQAWISRTNAYAKDVTEEGAMGFYEYQEKALAFYSEVNSIDPYIGEVYTRMIRLSMGTGEFEEAENYFVKATQKNKNALWPYIHMAEVIEPKWGGSLEKIQNLLKNLPDTKLIQQVVMLKFMLDSYTISENYLEDQPLEALDAKALVRLKSIHAELDSNPPTSPQKYLLYNYMYALAETIGETELQNIYFERVNGRYTLYPFGIIR
jgi:hypothetical protein